MRITQVEIGNFRKLVATSIAFADEKIVFVGANNSGKTSAMTASRAESSLALVAYADDPSRVKAQMIANRWFKPEEIHVGLS